jgi:hypothetical protein
VQHTSDRGQAIVPLALLVVMVALAVVGTARLADRAVTSSRVQLAADAAALAGVQAGAGAAAAAAERNGSTLTSFDLDGNDVVVAVELDGHSAQARAGR